MSERPESHSGLLGNFAEELGVRAERLEAVDQQLKARGRIAVRSEAAEDPAEFPDHLQLLAVEEQFFMASRGRVHVDRWVDTALCDLAIEA